MELYSNAPPAALGIPSKLLPRDPEALGTGTYPYGVAAQELGLLVLECCPQKKLDCIGERGRGHTSLGEKRALVTPALGRREEGAWSH